MRGGCSFDHLVGTQQKLSMNGQSEHSCRLEIYNKVELARLLDRYFGRFCAFEDLVDVRSGAPEKVAQICTIRKQTTDLHEFCLWMHGSTLVAKRQCDHALALAEKKRIVERDQAICLPLDHCGESARQALDVACGKCPGAETDCTTHPFHVLQVVIGGQ